MIISAFPAWIIAFRIHFCSSLVMNTVWYSYAKITKQLETSPVNNAAYFGWLFQTHFFVYLI